MTTQSALLLRSLAHLVDLRGWRWALPAVLLLLALAAPLGVMAATRLSIPQGALGNQVYNRNSGKCLDVANGSIANNANVQQFTCNGGTNQNWRLTNPTIGEYTFVVNRNSGKCLDVASGSVADGANVQQFTCNGGMNQQWLFIPDGQGYYQVINRNSGKCLDVANGSIANNANVQQFSCHGGMNQRWKWFPRNV